MNIASTFQHASVVTRRRLRQSALAQLAILVGIWAAAEALVHWLHLPVPGGIAGMVVVLALLLAGWLKLPTLKRGSEWLLADMLLFFVPAAMIVLDNPQLFGWLGLKLLAVVLFGTLLVMIATGLCVDLCWRLGERRRAR